MIYTEDELCRAIAAPPDPVVGSMLQTQAEALEAYEGYELAELAQFAMVQPNDTTDTIEQSLGWQLLDETGSFTRPAELISHQSGWYEVTFILSDDGFGLVLYVPKGERTDCRLLQACERALAELVPMTGG
jgi:hypothetical protein